MNYCSVFSESGTPCLDFFLFIVWPVLIAIMFAAFAWVFWGMKK